jgi:hypothetical protein
MYFSEQQMQALGCQVLLALGVFRSLLFSFRIFLRETN